MTTTATTEMTRPGSNGSGTALAIAPSRSPANLVITDEHRNILKGMVDRNATPAQVEMLIVVGNRYDLDPLMGHVVLINGKCFVTHKGLMHKAHTSGVFDGIRHGFGRDEQGDYCECYVFRKDMSHPFEGRIYLDEYRSAGPVWKQYPRAMAAKTAESFVLRRAFDVSLTSQEEMGVDREGDATAEAPRMEQGRMEQGRMERPRLNSPTARPAEAGHSLRPSPQDAPTCEDCGKELTRAQATLSFTKLGRTLCPVHQRSPLPAPPQEETEQVPESGFAEPALLDVPADDDGVPTGFTG